jgi:hypothetical protein
VAVFDRAFEVRMVANELLGVGDHDRALMAPKLLAKAPRCPAPSEAKSDGLTHPGRGTLKWQIAARPLTVY